MPSVKRNTQNKHSPKIPSIVVVNRAVRNVANSDIYKINERTFNGTDTHTVVGSGQLDELTVEFALVVQRSDGESNHAEKQGTLLHNVFVEHMLHHRVNLDKALDKAETEKLHWRLTGNVVGVGLFQSVKFSRLSTGDNLPRFDNFLLFSGRNRILGVVNWHQRLDEVLFADNSSILLVLHLRGDIWLGN